MIPLFSLLDESEKRIVDVLHSVEGWPIDFGKDADLVTRLALAYPRVDLYKEAVGFAAWMTEHTQKKKMKYRARFANWVKHADEWTGRNTRSRAAHRAPEQEGHGSVSRVSEGF